ncbi:MAG: ABC transporter ATP-binding protein [Myxococcota bacterium]
MGSDFIRISGFRKTFSGSIGKKPYQAVKDISFSVAEGEIFGFLGPNGAGKTTTIKALLGLIKPDAGTIEICGFPASSMGWRSMVGYLPEHPTFYDHLSGHELVTWFGQLSKMPKAAAQATAEKLLQEVGLGHAMHRRLRSYSKGMLQRAGIAQALVGNPRLLVLDEPMTGLDPLGRAEIRSLLLRLKHEGRTIFYSTHILPDVEMTCDRVAIVDRGEVRRVGALGDILNSTTRGFVVELSGAPMEAVVSWAPAGRVELKENIRVEFAHRADAQALVTRALQEGAAIERFEPQRDDLESIFLRSLAPSTPTAPGAAP